MPIREVRKSLTTTEFIELDSGETFIVDRKHTVETHRERIQEKENHSNKQKWQELDQTHRSDLEQQHLPKLVNQSEQGEQYILEAVLKPHKDDQTKQDAFGVQNIWWEATLNYLKSKAIGFIIGAIRGAIKDNIPAFVSFGVWLLEQLEDILIEQYKKIGDPQVRGMIRNELLQYEQTRNLAKKMEEVKK